MEATPWPVQIALIGVIAVYAYDRFNSPPTNRACTTAARYHVAAFIYFSLYVLTFNLLMRYPQLQELLAFKAEGAAGVSGAIGIALLLTVLLPRAPVLSQVDSRLRKFLQRRAAIPSEAARLSNELSRSAFEVPPEDREELERTLATAGFDARHVAYEGAEDTRSRWTQMEFLFAKLQALESDSKFAAFSHVRATECARLKERHANLRTKAKTCFELLDRLEEAGEDENFVQVVHAYERGFREDLDEMLKVMRDYISQAVLSCKLTHSGRWRQLAELGFQHDESETVNLGVNHVMALAVVLVPLFLANFIFFAPQRQDVGRGLLMAVLIVAVYCVSVTCAVIPKDRWAFTRRRDDGFRPWAFYVCAGLAAVTIGLPVTVGFKTLIGLTQAAEPSFGNVVGAVWSDLAAYKWPYFFLSFMTAAVTAFHLDNRPGTRLNGTTLRALEALSLSAALAATAFLVTEMLTRAAAGDSGVHVPPPERLMVIGAIVGGTIGWLIPHWYRRLSGAEAEAQARAEGTSSPEGLGHAAAG
jgi:hypothetical protein